MARERARARELFKKKNTTNHYHNFLFFCVINIVHHHNTYHARIINGDRHLSGKRFRSSVFGSSVAVGASASWVINHLRLEVVVVARVARHEERATWSGNAHEVAFVVKTGVAVRTQAELELVALLVALSLGEVHEGDVRDDGLLLVDIVVAPQNACLGSIPPEVAFFILGEPSGVFVIVIATIFNRFFAATPLASGRLGSLRHLLGLNCRSSRVHHSRHRSSHRCCLCQVTTIRVNVEKVFQFFPGVSGDRTIIKK